MPATVYYRMAYIHWNVRPELVQLGPFAIRWYGLLFALLFIIGYFIARWMFRTEHKDERSLDSLLVYLVVGTIVGARLGHVLFYDPVYYFHHPMEILEVWRGGLASHGGAIGVLVAMYLYTRKWPGQPYLWLVDRVVVPTALGACFIRLGNLFNSEIVGNPTHVPWAFVFERVNMVPRHPSQLYESLAYFLVFICLLLVYRRLRERTPHGLLLGLFLVSVFSFRFVIEFSKERQAAYEQNFVLSVGQWLSLPFITAGAILIWRALAGACAHKAKSPGRPGDPPTPG